jgi:hypothetical protein
MNMDTPHNRKVIALYKKQQVEALQLDKEKNHMDGGGLIAGAMSAGCCHCEGAGLIAGVKKFVKTKKAKKEGGNLERPIGGAKVKVKLIKKPVVDTVVGVKRSDIVKKVMKDKGLSMIEASKYVKSNGLYKK